ncbi:hypothetical protein CALCODRAFT_122133 [Calocera cornea HHB12733]|uniref:Uncharacterized protein n=1 Tax=Calocera cornea HHB12733 TaxID=1353952 RepID=A0A165CYS6_9BASI|nr:hypothetical protein CALCODRAFT_122133 [Calocera cornea HHB12733]
MLLLCLIHSDREVGLCWEAGTLAVLVLAWSLSYPLLRFGPCRTPLQFMTYDSVPVLKWYPFFPCFALSGTGGVEASAQLVSSESPIIGLSYNICRRRSCCTSLSQCRPKLQKHIHLLVLGPATSCA